MTLSTEENEQLQETVKRASEEIAALGADVKAAIVLSVADENGDQRIRSAVAGDVKTLVSMLADLLVDIAAERELVIPLFFYEVQHRLSGAPPEESLN